MSDQFATYLRLLEVLKPGMTVAVQKQAMKDGGFSFNDGEPISGYFRAAAVKNGPLLPIAIWRDETGAVHILRDGKPVALERVWPWCVMNPISYEWYEAKVERGEPWPDEHVERPAEHMRTSDERLSAGTAMADVPAADRPVTSTHNQAPEESEADALKRQVENAKDSAEKQYAEITSDEHAAQAQAARSRLNELAGTGDKKREAEKRPHLDKCKEIDTKWQPIIKMAKGAADAIRATISAYETKKYQAEQTARRAAEEEARAAAEKAAAEAKAKSEPVRKLPDVEEPVVPITTNGAIKGASGRAATIRTIKVAKVVDYDKAYAALKAIPEVKKVIDTVAQRLVNAGQNVPGVEVEEQRDVA